MVDADTAETAARTRQSANDVARASDAKVRAHVSRPVGKRMRMRMRTRGDLLRTRSRCPWGGGHGQVASKGSWKQRPSWTHCADALLSRAYDPRRA